MFLSRRPLHHLLSRSFHRPSTLGLTRNYLQTRSATSSSRPETPTPPSSSKTTLTAPNSLPSESLEPRLSLTFTCTVTDCGSRSTHTFTRRAYEKGIVIVQCPGCKNRHLIADHIGWFKESTQEGKLRTIEDILRARGERVTRGRLDAGGVVEYAESES